MIREPSTLAIATSAVVALVSASGAIAALDRALATRAPAVALALPPPPVVAQPARVESTPRAVAVAPPAPKPTCTTVVSVHFAYGVATLPQDVDTTLAPIVAFATAHPTAAIVIDGHADPTGSELGNLQLSKRRAGAVADELATLGVTIPITRRAFGAFVPTGTTDVKQAQRRAEVAIRDAACEGEGP